MELGWWKQNDDLENPRMLTVLEKQQFRKPVYHGHP